MACLSPTWVRARRCCSATQRLPSLQPELPRSLAAAL
jgi:hypothetical protein